MLKIIVGKNFVINHSLENFMVMSRNKNRYNIFSSAFSGEWVSSSIITRTSMIKWLPTYLHIPLKKWIIPYFYVCACSSYTKALKLCTSHYRSLITG